ncbi:unnamed protein product [Brassica napus]|uniref:(rape) hypothetical protein n=1 Tax=Brassica napus TaxID=3708 RepID=A0A816MVJ9_BRANA|nr:unnamed protein product [Brassica napus]
MDDSEKRKQILKAMRMEATAQNDCSEGSETSMNTGHLSNPLAEASTHQQESCEAPRFDYYTDPMSAYSSFKRNNTSKQEHISFPGNQMSPPAHQLPPSVPGTCQSCPWNNNYRPPPPPFNHLGPPQWVPRSFPFSQGNHDMGDNRFGGRGGSYNNTAPQFPQYGPRQAFSWAGNTYPSSARGRSRGRNTSFG